MTQRTQSIACPWCKATGADPCRTSDGQKRVPHKARARMTKANALFPPGEQRPEGDAR